MMKAYTKTAISLCVCAALASTIGAAVTEIPDGESPFAMQKLANGHMATVGDEEKEGEGSCGEGSCGGDNKDEAEGSCGEGSCGGDNKDEAEGSCGEGSCGADNKDEAEGTCGEGSCGGLV